MVALGHSLEREETLFLARVALGIAVVALQGWHARDGASWLST